MEPVAAFGISALVVQLAGAGIAAWKVNRPGPDPRIAAWRPPVSFVRPVCGVENAVESTLRSSFDAARPDDEILFCVADAADPVVPFVRALIAAHPGHDARLLVGDDRISVNPKLNNAVKGWRAARHDWIAMVDSNVLMPADFVARCLVRWDRDTGLVCAPPIGAAPEGLAAEVECAWLNSFQARWQIVADWAGFGFAQGKAMLFHRPTLDRAGGIEILGADVAEDAAATKAIRALGLKVRLVDRPFPQLLGRRTPAEVWLRQLRWARLRRVSFPLMFLPELLAGGLLPHLAVAALVATGSWSAGLGLAYAALWYGTDLLLARACGWPAGRRALAAVLIRDLALPALFAAAWTGNGFSWRGNAMTVADPTRAAPARASVATRLRALASGLR